MGTKAETQRGRFFFKVAEFGDGTPWIMTEPYYPEDRLPALGKDGFVGFDLKPGTTHQQAKDIAEFLNKHIESITCTIFD